MVLLPQLHTVNKKEMGKDLTQGKFELSLLSSCPGTIAGKRHMGCIVSMSIQIQSCLFPLLILTVFVWSLEEVQLCPFVCLTHFMLLECVVSSAVVMVQTDRGTENVIKVDILGMFCLFCWRVAETAKDASYYCFLA